MHAHINIHKNIQTNTVIWPHVDIDANIALGGMGMGHAFLVESECDRVTCAVHQTTTSVTCEKMMLERVTPHNIVPVCVIGNYSLKCTYIDMYIKLLPLEFISI